MSAIRMNNNKNRQNNASNRSIVNNTQYSERRKEEAIKRRGLEQVVISSFMIERSKQLMFNVQRCKKTQEMV
jgi:hypothetical protein